MRNLYNAAIEEDTVTSQASADSGSESNLSQDHQFFITNRVGPLKATRNKPTYEYESTTKDDFDDPTMLHMSPPSFLSSSSTNHQFRHGNGYEAETVLDMDDPVSAQGLRRINSNNTSVHSSKRAALRKRGGSGRDDSAISLPSTSGASSTTNGKKKSSSVQSLRSEASFDAAPARNRIRSSGDTINNAPISNNGKTAKRTQNQSLLNNNGIHQSDSTSSVKAKNTSNGPSSLNSNSSNSKISSRKLSKSTMIDSPLHLDPIT